MQMPRSDIPYVADLYGETLLGESNEGSAVRKKLADYFPGLAAVTIAAAAATWFSEHYGMPVILAGLLLGLALNFISTQPKVHAGLDLCGTTGLRWGIVLLGTQVTAMQIGSLGGLALAPAIDPRLRYDPIRDVTPIASVAVTHYVLVVHPSVPAKSVQDLLRIARERRGQLNYGSSGVGSISHLIAEALQSAVPGVEMVHVAYKGLGPALSALLGGEIDLAFITLPQAEGPASMGRLRMLAATGSRRPDAAKGIPTLVEAGLRLHPVEGSYGLVGPAALPREVVLRLNAAVNAALKAPDFRQRFASQGFEAVAPNAPEDYARQIRADLEVFGQVVKRAGIKPEN
jgi:tripartite-type tricarboxylate transporter receptor subunit TctC